MTVIRGVLAVPATRAGSVEDRSARAASPFSAEARSEGQPATPGVRRSHELAEAVSVGLVLEAGPGPLAGRQVAWGDCLGVASAATAGREPPFRAEAGLIAIREVVAPFLLGRSLVSFRELSGELEALTETVREEVVLGSAPTEASDPATGVSRRALLTAPFRASPLREVSAQGQPSRTPRPDSEWRTVERPVHAAVRYGVSQALLHAVALARGVSMAEVIAAEWSLAPPEAPVAVHAHSGADRTADALKMILRRVASLPHAMVDDIEDQVGEDGGKMTRYIRWLAAQIAALAGPEYRPAIHLDLHGALGVICDQDPGRMLGQLYAWERAALPYLLRVECPTIRNSREEQIEILRTLRDYLRFRKMKVHLVADEWVDTLDDIKAFLDAGAADMIHVRMPDLGGLHNSVEAVLACRAAAVGALLGGSHAESDLSGCIAAHVALATRPDLVMARPGMGVDEAVSLVENEMARTLALIGWAGQN